MTDSNAAAVSVSGSDISGTFKALRTALMRYYDTPFGVDDRSVMEERRMLLDVDGGAWREPLLELRPQYKSSGVPLAESFRAAKAHPQAAEFARFTMPSGVDSLYQHQHDALVTACGEKRDFVVTAGTGSGKTEAFMLPVIADLVAESEKWAGTGASQPAWWRRGKTFEPSRQNEHGHPAAVRALILYPTNALADDQLVRLRRALDSKEARDWLDQHRRGHRFYFGRYTGATPVSGSSESTQAAGRLREYMQELDARQLRAGDEVHDFMPRLGGAEMHARWDMQAAAPDVLITNYSMLNIMLLRPQEASIFESTRRWLHSTPGACFTLVLDELHMYRGTAGTEVAYMLRNLRHRLGLDEAPEKFRVLAASASLEADRDNHFLESFFALPKGRHRVIPGSLELPEDGPADLSGHAAELAMAAEGELSEERASELLYGSAGGDALARVLAPEGKPKAIELPTVADTLFPGLSDSVERGTALHGLLRALGASIMKGLPKLRAHMFFRNIDGIWACSDPECPDVPVEKEKDRRVGRLFREPTSRCTCGARVLELLYCQNCGDLMLGGYTAPSLLGKDSFRGALHTDYPELDQLPDLASGAPNAGNYVVYWPSQDRHGLDKTEWEVSRVNNGPSVSFHFRASKYHPGTGRLANDKAAPTGWSFHAVPDRGQDGKPLVDLRGLKAFPTRCPACGDDWEIRRGKDGKWLDIEERLRSAPVRRMRTGFDKINQVLTSEALGHMPDGERKIIAFSDSRDDASDLASGLALRHYQDLLRLLTARAVADQGDPFADLQLVKAYYEKKTPDPDQMKAAARRLRDRHPREFSELKDILTDDPMADPAKQPELESVLGRLPSLTDLQYDLRGMVLERGLNPGGPAASLQECGNGVRWTSLFDWKGDKGIRAGLEPEQEELLKRLNESLGREFLLGLFSSAGRDFESLGLGWLSLATDRSPLDMAPDSDVAVARASLRILGHMRRFSGLRAGLEKAPAPLKRYWEDLSQRYGGDMESYQDRVLAVWGQAVAQYTIDPSKVALRTGDGRVWICSSCRRPHLHPGTLLCTKCRTELPTEAGKFTGALKDDYYAWKADSRTGDFPLRAVELTGQTDRLDAQARQARFQNVYIGEDSVPEADGIEVLSVTTTMEAGVDVGSLNTVLMANMPPTRFNYQQRVGRAGRRDSPAATALTVCRGRSHDEHYFASPEEITNAPTPAPYLALGMPSIFKRVLLGEVLRQAFESFAKDGSQHDGDMTRNVHGEFGQASDWSKHRPAVWKWVNGNAEAVRSVSKALQSHTLEPVASLDPVACVLEALGEIDDIAESVTGHPDLSQRLAESGLLPMFGFPTRARLLYTEVPQKNFPWPPQGAVNRDLAVALTKFAPGSETPMDGRLYQSMGVVSFTPGFRAPKAVEEPFGPEEKLAMCRLCAHIEPVGNDAEPQECPACGAAGRNYTAFPVREPAGFRAGQPRDYDGVREWGSSSASPRTAANLETDAPRVERDADDWLVVHCGTGDRYTVNNNNGRLFRFKKAGFPWKGYHVVDNPRATSDFETALGATEHTDMLFIGARNALDAGRGLRFDMSHSEQASGFPDAYHGRRAAWYSLSALLRRAAAPLLDVQPEELLSGIHGSASAASPVMAYLADSLENGAGFSTHLGSSERIEEFLDAVDDYVSALRGEHAATCGGSCYRCLRDYSNMRIHPLLDWRLARDLLGVLRGTPLFVDSAHYGKLLERWAEDRSGLEARITESPYGKLALAEADLSEEPVAVAVKHPLEALLPDCEALRLRRITAYVKEKRLAEQVAFVDAYCLDRIPAAVTSDIIDFAEGL